MIILLFWAGFSSLNAQTIVVTGKVTDTLQQSLSYANILAVPESDNNSIAFAITEDNGNYKLRLEQNETYKVTCSYLGFLPKTITITANDQSLTKNFILEGNPSQLDEVTLNYTPPITVKKDTITYQTDKFVTGEERKLRDVLKKLPGVEVDRAGNVTVQGKKVTKVLVENQPFFTGNSKLAVNNIPADAVNEIEVLDNYNEVAMLKGLQDSEDMAININLKEGKKKFVFGDLEVGAGVEDRYLLHPSLFYYSPKTNMNLIGDLNNEGIKSFTFADYLEFEGGFGKLIGDIGGYFNLVNNDFSKYLNNQDFKESSNQFGAINIRQSVNNATDISGYVIASKGKTETEINVLNDYINSGNPFTEDRTTANNLNNFFTIGKVTVDYDPSYEEDLAYNSFVKITDNDGDGLITTINPDQNNTINTIEQNRGLNIKQNISYSRKFSKDHTATLEATYNFQNDKPTTNWQTNQEILQGLIPLDDDVIFDILQTRKTKAHTFNAIVKDYWVLNNFNHLYFSIGANLSFNELFTEDVQQLSDGTINNFTIADFGNDFDYDLVNTFLGLEYKFQIGKTTVKPALYYQFYSWQTQQLGDNRFSNKIALLLPQLTTKVEFNNSEKINFRYKLNARFPTINRLANRFVLNSFNSVFKGNAELDNQLYHTASLSYYKFSLFRNLNLNFNTTFNKKLKHYKSVTELQGIESFSTQILFDEPEYNWSLRGSIAKKINKIRYKFNTSFNYNDFFQILNNETNKNISKSVSSTISATTFFKNFPNLEIGYTKDFNSYRSIGNINKFENDRFFAFLEYDFLKDFILKADYSFDSYINKNSDRKNTFDTANASLFYQKEDSPWGFEVSATNLFNTAFKQDNSFSNFLISDNRTFILPRIIMFKLAYKL